MHTPRLLFKQPIILYVSKTVIWSEFGENYVCCDRLALLPHQL